MDMVPGFYMTETLVTKELNVCDMHKWQEKM